MSQLLVLIGVDDASLKILICTLLSFPFSIIFKRLPDHDYTLKNVYVILVSSFYVFGILELRGGLVTLLVSAMGCYFITRYLRTKSMPWVNFLFLMLHLAWSHVHTQFFVEYDPTIIDITGAQMVLVMKLTAFGWNIHDGKQDPKSVSPYCQSRVIKKHPNLLPYLGYVFFYASVLTGPAFDYMDYDRFIHSTLFNDVPDEKRPGKRKRRIPRSGVETLKKVLHGAFWASLFFVGAKYVNLRYVLSGDLVQEHGFVYRAFYLWVLGLFHRLRYYTIWLIAEGACILCGIGYNGYDPETEDFKWNRVQNIDPYAFETGQNVHACLEAWNMNTNKWLKNYVYFRIARPGKKPGFKSTLFTFATSAFWHGTRPGYYLTFVLGAFLQTLGRIYRRNFRPMFLKADGTPKPSKKIYDVISYFVTQLTFGFVCQPFVILDFRQSLYCWSTVYFYVPIVTAVTLLVFKGPYGKQVSNWCKQYHDQYQAEQAAKAAAASAKLSDKEAAIVEIAVDNLLTKDEEAEIPTLGLPSIDALQEASKEEFDSDMKELSEAWSSFKGRRGSIKDDDFEGLKDAYNNFTNEIVEIFNGKKEALERIKKDMEESKEKEKKQD